MYVLSESKCEDDSDGTFVVWCKKATTGMTVFTAEYSLYILAVLTPTLGCLILRIFDKGSLRPSCKIDDLWKSRGLHLVSAYRHGLYIYRSRPAGVAQSRHAFVGGTVSTWAR